MTYERRHLSGYMFAVRVVSHIASWWVDIASDAARRRHRAANASVPACSALVAARGRSR